MTQDFSSFLKQRLAKQILSDERTSLDRSELKIGERREISVLFLDLGGFTALSERLDHEEVHDISRGVMDALVDITENYGGYVDKIEGDRIMVLFGARMTGENDSERAISCGLLMLKAIGTANDILAETGVPITARIGINSGPVTVAPDAIGHLTAIGNTVNLASRMEENAEENTILVPEEVREKCLELFRWEDRGQVRLKGIHRSVHVFSPIERLFISRPRWERLTGVSFAGFVGRRQELAELKCLAGRQRSAGVGENRTGTAKHIVARIMGEAGIGKSRLVHEFLMDQCSGDPSLMVLKGQTLSYAQPAYSLWTSVLRNFLNMGPGNSMDYVRLKLRVKELTGGDELERSLPFLAELLSIRSGDRRLSELDSEAVALETRIAFRNLIKAIAARKNLIVVLDDLHWMDSTCSGVLKFVIENCSVQKPVLFLLVGRRERDDGTPVEFRFGSRYAELVDIPISCIDEEESRGIVSTMLSGIGDEMEAVVSSRTMEFLLDHSQGNPFFLEELVLDMVESGVIRRSEGHWEFSRPVDDIYVPPSLAGLLQARLDRLSEEQRGSLQKSSVLGFEFRMSLYSKLLEELDLNEETERIFSGLERRQFLLGKETTGEYVYEFRHILIHDTVYSTILDSNKKLLHRITAGLIEEAVSYDGKEAADILTHHWGRAGDRSKAVHWGIISLRHSVAAYQHERVLELSGKLESWIREEPLDGENIHQLLEVMLRRYETLSLLGRREEEEALLLSMEELADRFEALEWQGKVQSSLGSHFRMTGRIQEADNRYRKALDIHEASGNRVSQAKVLCNLGLLCRVRGEMNEAMEFFHSALESNSDSKNLWVEGVILGNLGNLHFDMGQLDESIEYYQRALDLSREVGDRRSEGIALGNLGNPWNSKGDLEKAMMYYRQALEIHRETGNRRSEGVTLSNMSLLYCDHQRCSRSRECGEEALEIHVETGNRKMQAITIASLALVSAREGDLPAALEQYTDTIELIDSHELSRTGFDHFGELRRVLLSSGFTEEQVPLPAEWLREGDS